MEMRLELHVYTRHTTGLAAADTVTLPRYHAANEASVGAVFADLSVIAGFSNPNLPTWQLCKCYPYKAKHNTMMVY